MAKGMTNKEKKERAAIKKQLQGGRDTPAGQAEAEPEEIHSGSKGRVQRLFEGMHGQ